MKEHVRDFLKEYVTNLFIIWGFFEILTSEINEVSLIFELREFIWVNHIYVVIFWMIAAYVSCRIYIPLWNNLKKLSRVNKRLTFFIDFGLVMTIAAEGIFFFIGIMGLIADQHPEFIIDQIKFDRNIETSLIIMYFLLPVFIYLLKHGARKTLIKNNLEIKISKKMTDYPVEITIIMTLTFVFSSIYVILINNNLI